MARRAIGAERARHGTATRARVRLAGFGAVAEAVLPAARRTVVLQSPLGSLPAVTGAQVPFDCPVIANVHASQTPAQGLSQQTPSTQNPLPHVASSVQGSPLAGVS